MLHHVIQVLIYALAVLLAAKVVPGIRVRSFGSAVGFAVVFAILNKLLFVVLTILALPMVLLTFGFFLLVINAFLFWLADKVIDGVEVDGAFSAFLGSLVAAIISIGLTWLLPTTSHIAAIY